MEKTRKEKSGETNLEFEIEKTRSAYYILKLYVTGTTPHSVRAIQNIREICEKHLHGRYILEVIDLYKRPSLASGEQIIAAPTLIKQLPLPLRRIIGDMSNIEKVLVGLDLKPGPPDPPENKDAGKEKKER